MRIHLRPVNRFVTTGGPARPLREPRRVVRVADENSARDRLLLEMALQTQRLIAFRQHPLIH